MAKRLLRISPVEGKVGYRKSKIYKMISAGEFPRPVKLGHVSVWPEEEVDAWIDARIAERGEAADA